MSETLTREGDHAFRKEPDEEGKRGLAYECRLTPIWFKVRNVQRFASNVASAGLEKGTEEDQARQTVNGDLEAEDQRDFGFISEEGPELLRGERLQLNINLADTEGGSVWFQAADDERFQLRRAFYFSVHLSRTRLLWLWNELQDRPNAEFRVMIDVPVYQFEVDAFLAEPWMRQEFFFIKGERTEIESVSLYVEDPVQNGGSPDVEPITPIVAPKSPEVVLLRRVVRGVGWLIALHSLALLSMCAAFAERGSL